MLPGRPAGRAPLGFGLLKHLGNRGAGKDVVELLEQQGAPIRRGGLAALQSQQGGGELRLPQQPLQAAVVAFLVGPAGGTAAVQLQIELIAPHRQAGLQRLEPAEVVPQGAVLLRAGQRLLLPELELLQQLRRGAAAMVSHPRQPQGFGHTTAPLPLQPVGLHRHRVAIGADRRVHQGQHLGTTATAPAEQPMGEGIGGVPGQLVGAEPAHAGGLGHGRQPRGKAEAVRQPAQLVAPLREALTAVALTLQKLAQQGGRADQNAVGLHPGAVDGLPATGLHGAANGGEQGGLVLLDPGVESWGGVGEVQLGIALQQRQGRAEGADRRLPGVGHRPQPGQVQVGVTEHLESPRWTRHSGLRQQGNEAFRGRWVPGVERFQGCGQRLGLPQGLQLKRRGLQHGRGIGGIAGLQLHLAGHQGPIVVERGAQQQLQHEGLSLPPGLRQQPATGGIEQVALMHLNAIHPQHHGIGPPAQHQPRLAIPLLALLPLGWTLQPALQRMPTPPTGPHHQAAGCPIGPVQTPPGVVEGRPGWAIRGGDLPEGAQIQPGSCLKRFNPGANHGLRGLRHRSTRSRPIG